MTRRRVLPSLALCVVALVAAACSSSSSGSTTTGTVHGTADVGYAGSLVTLVETTLQPAFEHATGDSFIGKGEGSTALAQSILDHELDPGAFVSVGAKAITLLWPTRSRFALVLGTDPLVVAYSEKSRYYSELHAISDGAKPLTDLFTLLEQPGFRLGRTDPNLDPQGGYFELMFQLAERELHLPSTTAATILGTSASNAVGSPGQIFDETVLPTDLATGNVDAGSAYLTEAREDHLDYITLPPALDFADPADLSLYETVSLPLTGGATFQGDLITLDCTLVSPPRGESRPAADTAADEAFLSFLLSETGEKDLSAVGYELHPPALELAPGFSRASQVLPPRLLAAYEGNGGNIESS